MSRYPKVKLIRAERPPKCSICGDIAAVTTVIQTGWMKDDEHVFRLCQAHYAETGAKEMPVKSQNASEHGRGPELIAAYRKWRAA